MCALPWYPRRMDRRLQHLHLSVSLPPTNSSPLTSSRTLTRSEVTSSASSISPHTPTPSLPTTTSTATQNPSTTLSHNTKSHPSTVTLSPSESTTTSVVTSKTFSSHPTPTPSQSTTPHNYCLSIPSCFSKGATVRAITRNITVIDLHQHTMSQCMNPQVSIGYGLWSASGVLWW